MAFCLLNLLPEEIFLKILAFVDYESFEDCRQVCHSWNRACDKAMLVKLRFQRPLSGVETSKMLLEYSEAFPNAVFLHHASNVCNYGQAKEVLRSLLHFPCLNRLKIAFAFDVFSQIHINGQLKYINKIQSIDIAISMKMIETSTLNAIRCLTNLTSLTLCYSDVISNISRSIEPFTELQKLKNLSLSSESLLLKNVSHPNFVLFPFLTQLKLSHVDDLGHHDDNVNHFIIIRLSCVIGLHRTVCSISENAYSARIPHQKLCLFEVMHRTHGSKD